jgi:hypothetical protein
MPMRRPGADFPVVVMRRGNARGAKGAGHRRRKRANWRQDELQCSAEGGSFRFGGGSRMTRECQSPDLRAARGEIPRADSAFRLG